MVMNTKPVQLSSVIVIVAVLAWYLFFEPPWLTYGNLPFPVVNDGPVKAGSVARASIKKCNSDDKPHAYIVSHTLVCDVDRADPERIALPAAARSIQPGCTKNVRDAAVVPPGTKPGKCFLEGHAEIQGTVRSHVVHWYTEPFEVVP